MASTEGGGTPLGVFAAMVTTGPLAIDKESRMVHTLKQDILSTVCKQNGGKDRGGHTDSGGTNRGHR